VRSLDAGAWFDERFTGGQILLLEEAFSLLKESSSNLEIKRIQTSRLIRTPQGR
jgi:hypothetical protein